MVGGHAWEAKFGITLWIRCKKTEVGLDSNVKSSPNAGSGIKLSWWEVPVGSDTLKYVPPTCNVSVGQVGESFFLPLLLKTR